MEWIYEFSNNFNTIVRQFGFFHSTNLQLEHQNMSQHRRHMQRPTFRNALTHSRRSLEMMSPFYSTVEPQYLQYAQMDPETWNIVNILSIRHWLSVNSKRSRFFVSTLKIDIQKFFSSYKCTTICGKWYNMTVDSLFVFLMMTNNFNTNIHTSFPSGIPLPRVAVNPITLATSVLNVRYSLSVTPRNIVFISGIPEPILCGATRWTKPAEKRIKHTGNDTHAKYCTYGCDVRSLYNQILATIISTENQLALRLID